jgi:toxin YoeB
MADQANEDVAWWNSTDQNVLKRINKLIDNCRDTPFSGIGKPEPLKHDLSGLWSRRITKEHRLVYQVESGTLFVLSCRYHY